MQCALHNDTALTVLLMQHAASEEEKEANYRICELVFAKAK